MNPIPSVDAHDDDEPPLWRFIRLADHKPPRADSSSVAAGAWASARRFFSPTQDRDQAPLKQEAELRALQEVRLAHMVRPIDWRAASEALDAALGDWPQAAAGPCVRVVVGPPHGGHAEIVASWGERHAAHRVDAPDETQILSGAIAASGRAPLPPGLWVLPRLEHTFLRHADGLALVRQWLQQATDGHAGPGLIGCDSWAWAYLGHVWSGPMPEALTLQPFDGPRLASLFAQLAEPVEPAGLSFRNARTGNDVLAVPRLCKGDEVSDDIVRIAVHCRGNPGTARSYWRVSLRDAPELAAGAGSDPEPSDDPTVTSDRDTVWVSADAEGPSTPAEVAEDTALVLHTLLIHGGLRAPMLPTLLPMAAHQTGAVLLQLKSLALVECAADDRWQVSPLGYAAVRELLRARGYLTDPL